MEKKENTQKTSEAKGTYFSEVPKAKRNPENIFVTVKITFSINLNMDLLNELCGNFDFLVRTLSYLVSKKHKLLK